MLRLPHRVDSSGGIGGSPMRDLLTFGDLEDLDADDLDAAGTQTVLLTLA